MIKLIKKIFYTCDYYIDIFKHNLEVRKYKELYPDYEDNEYNYGSLKFIWGIKSWDDLTNMDACIHSMNDIDIIYDRDTDEYMLGIETIYMWDKDRKENECKYLKRLLDYFTKFMDDNNYNKNYDMCLFCMSPELRDRADNIPELYMNFRIFVEGYCSVYGY